MLNQNKSGSTNEQNHPPPNEEGTALVTSGGDNENVPPPPAHNPSPGVSTALDNQPPLNSGETQNKTPYPTLPLTTTAGETADEVDNDGQKKRTRRKTNPSLQAQLTALIQRLDHQAARTDELYTIVRPPPVRQIDSRTQPTGDTRSPPQNQDRRRHKKHVNSSHYKRRRPKSGNYRIRDRSREGSRASRRSNYLSHSSSDSDMEAQVRQAREMMEPKFDQYSGKYDLQEEIQAF